MYYDLFNLLSSLVYGSDAVLTSYQELTLTLVSTGAVLFVCSLPFLVVWQLIKRFL